MDDNLTKSAFAKCLGTTFVLARGAETVALELVEVESLSLGARNDASFSLVFRAAGGQYLPQATYRLSNEGMGTIDMFIVPIRRDAGGIYYEAIYNRPPAAAES